MSDAVLAADAPSTKRPRRARIMPDHREWVAMAAVSTFVVAVLARGYALRNVPRFTDETDEIVRGLSIARGELLPLTNVDAYIGPLWNYLLALGFAIVGPTSALPRLLTVVVGLLTVGVTARLGRDFAHALGWGARADVLGLGAALMLAASSFHAIVSSRIGWSHALTPLAMTLALVCLLRWERTRSDRALAGLGLAYGLAVHTHPTALAFASGLGIWALLHWRETAIRRGGWIALGLFVLANLPMLAFNVATGFASAREAAQVQSAYAGGVATSPESYLRNLWALLTSLPLLFAGEIGVRRGVMRTLDAPVAFAFAGLVVVGACRALRQHLVWPLLLFVSAILVMPIFNGKYEPLFNGRYLAPVLPLAYVLAVTGVVTLVDALRLSPPGWRPSIVAAIVVALCIPSLSSLDGYVRVTESEGPTNKELYRASEIVAGVASSKPVLVDASLSGTRHSTGREGTGVMEYLLTMQRGLTVRRYQPNDLAAAVERGESDLAVVSPRLLTRIEKDFATEMPPGEREARSRRRGAFAVVRVVGRAGEPGRFDLVGSGRSGP